MALSKRQIKYLKKHYRRKSLVQIAKYLDVNELTLANYLNTHGIRSASSSTPSPSQQTTNSTLWKNIKAFSLKTWWLKNRIYIGFLILLTIVVYVNSLNNSFVSDDRQIMLDPKLNQSSFIMTGFPAFFRPLQFFFINSIFGRVPLYFRVANLLFHVGTVLTVYLLISISGKKVIAAISAGVIAVHPVLTEAVTWISGGPYSEYTFFLLLSLLFYIFSQRGKKFLIFSVLCFLAALFTSEKAIVFPGIMFLFILCFKNLRRSWKDLIPFFSIGFIWGLVYLGKIGERQAILEASYYQKQTFINPLIQIPVALSSYLELIFWPQRLTLYHSEMHFTPLGYTIRLLVTLVYFGTLVFSFFKSKRVFFWLSIFLVSLLPTLTPLGISWIVAERYAYFGAVAIITATVITAYNLLGRKLGKETLTILFALIILILAVRTIYRNFDWKNEDSLWIASAKYSPTSPQNHNNLGDLYFRRDELDKAAHEFSIAIQLKPDYGDAFHNLGNTLYKMGRLDEAISNYQKALSANPYLWQSYQSLAKIYLDRNQLELSSESLEKAISINKENPNLYHDLGIIYLKIGQKDLAKESFQKALFLNPQDQKTQQELLKIL